jgi:hypothetical protein
MYTYMYNTASVEIELEMEVWNTNHAAHSESTYIVYYIQFMLY